MGKPRYAWPLPTRSLDGQNKHSEGLQSSKTTPIFQQFSIITLILWAYHGAVWEILALHVMVLLVVPLNSKLHTQTYSMSSISSSRKHGSIRFFGIGHSSIKNFYHPQLTMMEMSAVTRTSSSWCIETSELSSQSGVCTFFISMTHASEQAGNILELMPALFGIIKLR